MNAPKLVEIKEPKDEDKKSCGETTDSGLEFTVHLKRGEFFNYRGKFITYGPSSVTVVEYVDGTYVYGDY